MTILHIAVLAGLALTNLTALIMMGVDKGRARKGKWRIRERTLFLAAACFGALGGTLGMFLFHHKTRHWYFRIGFPALLIAQAAILWMLVR